jgi:2-oxoglutarate dehydrogenase E2 component (dihydrolipoamide succinyltransferase)
MTVEVKVPVLPESVADATIANWHKKAGDAVTEGENLVDVETDKVVLEVPAPVTGVLTEITAPAGTTVTAKQVIGAIKAGAAAAKPVEAAAPQKVAPAAAAANSADLSPSVRRIVAEQGLDPSKIAGSGPGGRITKEDAMNHAKSQPTAPAPAASAAVSEIRGERPERRVAMTRLRQRIAERLVQAQQTAALLTTFNEVNMQPVMELRNRYKDQFEKAHGVKLGFMSFFVKAAIEALKKFPAVNASIDGNDIIYHGYYDVGIAVGSERGLVVPVLREADSLTFAEIEKGIAEFGNKAKAGTLTLEELTGGTFTISNGGIFGSLLSTPILNPPQSGILGMHKIQERPMVENGQIVIRPMMYLALTYDHRIIDGREAVQFLVAIKDALEDPARLLLQL